MPHVLLNSMVGWVGEAVQTQSQLPPVAFPSAARSSLSCTSPMTTQKWVINPRRACAARVTVLALSVCVCVCVFRRNPSSLRPKSSTYRFIIGFCWISTCGFLKKPSVQELWRHLLTTITAARSMALFSNG